MSTVSVRIFLRQGQLDQLGKAYQLAIKWPFGQILIGDQSLWSNQLAVMDIWWSIRLLKVSDLRIFRLRLKPIQLQIQFNIQYPILRKLHEKCEDQYKT